MSAFAAAEPWPERLGTESGERGVIYEYLAASSWFGRTLQAGADGSVSADADAIEMLAASLGVTPGSLTYESHSAHVVSVVPAKPGDAGDGYRYRVFASAEPCGRLHRTWFRVSHGIGDAAGIAVLMPGMLGTPHRYVEALERSLHVRGWTVARMLVPPSRSTERYSVAINPAGDPSSIASLAAELDTRTAECAFAVDAMVSALERSNPDIVGTRRVVIGISGTGMMLPAVLALRPERFDAAAVIGGGANAFAILRDSSYARMLDSVRVTWLGDPPDATQTRALDRAYLDAAKLDAAVISTPRMGDRVLLVHASRDRAVPASSGDLLWSALGQPERWSTSVGHELLFVRAMLQIPELLDWLESAADQEGGGR
ncbi:MAG: hypothetical protein AAFR96_00085 [Planctomycetota bacterium]